MVSTPRSTLYASSHLFSRTNQYERQHNQVRCAVCHSRYHFRCNVVHLPLDEQSQAAGDLRETQSEASVHITSTSVFDLIADSFRHAGQVKYLPTAACQCLTATRVFCSPRHLCHITPTFPRQSSLSQRTSMAALATSNGIRVGTPLGTRLTRSSMRHSHSVPSNAFLWVHSQAQRPQARRQRLRRATGDANPRDRTQTAPGMPGRT